MEYGMIQLLSEKYESNQVTSFAKAHNQYK